MNMSKACCGTKKNCTPSKVSPKTAKQKHELDMQLQDQAMQILAKDYIKLAKAKDNNCSPLMKLFRNSTIGSATNRALDNLESAFDMNRSDFASYSRLA